MNHISSRGKSILHRGLSQCKGPEAWVGLGSWRKSKEVHMSGVKLVWKVAASIC